MHPCGSACYIATSACYLHHCPLQILQLSAQNPFRAEDFCSIIIEVQILETQKPQISHHYDIDVLQWSRSGRVAYRELESHRNPLLFPSGGIIGEKYFLTCCREICNGDFRNDDYDYFAINGQSANSSNADAASGMSCSRAKFLD